MQQKLMSMGGRAVLLAMQIEVQAHLHFGKAQNNFLATLPLTRFRSCQSNI